jgi:hypothetical protein
MEVNCWAGQDSYGVVVPVKKKKILFALQTENQEGVILISNQLSFLSSIIVTSL